MPHAPGREQTQRLLAILRRLVEGECLSLGTLAKDYLKSERTIRRDLSLIAQFFPLKREGKCHRLDLSALTASMDSLTRQMLRAFASNAALDVPCLDRSNLSEAKIAFAIDYNGLPKHLGEKIAKALEQGSQCRFAYRDREGKSSKRRVDPVYLFTDKGMWYLISRDYKDDGIKHFRLDRMAGFEVLEEAVTLTAQMREEAAQKMGTWDSGGERQTVMLYIKPAVATYFKQGKLLHPTQEVADKHADGGLVLHCTITHEMEILPAVMSWLPHIHIIEPKWLWESLQQNLHHYLHEDEQIRHF